MVVIPGQAEPMIQLTQRHVGEKLAQTLYINLSCYNYEISYGNRAFRLALRNFSIFSNLNALHFKRVVIEMWSEKCPIFSLDLQCLKSFN